MMTQIIYLASCHCRHRASLQSGHNSRDLGCHSYSCSTVCYRLLLSSNCHTHSKPDPRLCLLDCTFHGLNNCWGKSWSCGRNSWRQHVFGDNLFHVMLRKRWEKGVKDKNKSPLIYQKNNVFQPWHDLSWQPLPSNVLEVCCVLKRPAGCVIVPGFTPSQRSTSSQFSGASQEAQHSCPSPRIIFA